MWRHRCVIQIRLSGGKKEIPGHKVILLIITSEEVLINELFSLDRQLSRVLFSSS